MDVDTEFIQVKLMLRLYQVIGELRQQNAKLVQDIEVLNKGKKPEKVNVRKS